MKFLHLTIIYFDHYDNYKKINLHLKSIIICIIYVIFVLCLIVRFDILTNVSTNNIKIADILIVRLSKCPLTILL